jgi:hypothetical protein
MRINEGSQEFEYDSADLAVIASRMTGYVRIKVDVNVAFALADKSPYPRGVRLGIMKQVANSKFVTLEQMRILLGFAAQRAQR